MACKICELSQVIYIRILFWVLKSRIEMPKVGQYDLHT